MFSEEEMQSTSLLDLKHTHYATRHLSRSRGLYHKAAMKVAQFF